MADSYRLLDRDALSAAEYSDYGEEYPALADGSVYVLNTKDKETISRLNDIFGVPILIVSGIEQRGVSSIPGLSEIVPEGADPFPIIAQIPQEQIDMMLAQFDTAVAHAAIPSADGAAYGGTLYRTRRRLGIQTMYILRVGGMMLL